MNVLYAFMLLAALPFVAFFVMKLGVFGFRSGWLRFDEYQKTKRKQNDGESR